MPKVVRIEGVGNVAFPDDMDDAAISHAIETDILSQPGVAKNVPGTVANTALQRIHQRATEQSTVPSSNGPGPVRRFLQGAGVPTSMQEVQAMEESIDPAVQLMRGNPLALAGPAGLAAGSTLHAIGSGMGDQAGQALDAAQQHDVGGYLRHSFGAATPLVGPQLAEGNIAGAMGTTAALLAPTVIGKAADVLAIRRSTVPIRTTVEAPPAGAVRQTIGRLAKKTLPGAVSDVLEPLWSGGGTRTQTTRVPLSSITDAAGGVAPVQPIRPRTIGPDFDPRAAGGRFAPTKSIPLVGDPPRTPVMPPRSTVSVSGFGPATPPESVPTSVPAPAPAPVSASVPTSTPAPSNGLVGQPVRFSRGNSRAHGTVISVRGDVARVKNASGMSVRVPVSQLTILQKASDVPTTPTTTFPQ